MSTNMPYLLGSDIGTSSVKSIVISAEGELVGEAVREYPMHRPQPGWAENDPEDWVESVLDTARRAIAHSGVEPSSIRGWSVVSQRDPAVLLDAEGRVLTPSISWVDRRTLDINRELTAKLGFERLVDTTGVRPIGGLTLHNLIWTKRNLPEIWWRLRHVLFAKDYVLYRLTGIMATDISTPSRSVMNDVRRSDWSAAICEAMEIDIGLLPPIRYKPWEVWEELSPKAASLVGLAPGTPLAAGGGDDQAAALGAGVIDSGDLCAGTGTASCWRSVSDRCDPDPQGRADLSQHVVPDRFVYEATIVSTGSSLRWLRDTFASELLAAEKAGGQTAYEELVGAAGRIPLGADGLLYFPYLEGARTPRYNDDATGVFFGLTAAHSRDHFVRALLEGVAFQYPPSLALLRSWGMSTGRISMVDGESRSAMWNQIKADILGVPIAVPRVIQSAAVGSAILAGLAADLFKDARSGVGSMIHWERVYEPDLRRHQLYDEIRQRYECVYKYLDGAFRCGHQG